MKTIWFLLLAVVSRPALCQEWEDIRDEDGQPAVQVAHLQRRPPALWGMAAHCRSTDGELEVIVLHSDLQALVDSADVPGVMHALYYGIDAPAGLDAPPLPENVEPPWIAVACVHASRCIFAEKTAWELVKPIATEDHETCSFEILGLRFAISLKKAREKLSKLYCVHELIGQK